MSLVCLVQRVLTDLKSLVAPLAWHPDNRNAVIVCDLAADISLY